MTNEELEIIAEDCVYVDCETGKAWLLWAYGDSTYCHVGIGSNHFQVLTKDEACAKLAKAQHVYKRVIT